LEAKVLDKINTYRKTLGLNPVKGFDSVLSKGCQAHAEYLVKNSNHPSTAGLGMHNEDAKIPGYSKEGERAGKNSVIASLDPLEAVDSWMATPFHRRPFLNPDLKQIGLGTAVGGKLGRLTVLDAGTDVGTEKPIFYPYDKQRDIPLAYQPGERPSPIPEGNDNPAGYPITVSFPSSNIVKNVTAILKDNSGKDYPVWLSTPEKPTTTQLQRNTVCAIAKAPLRGEFSLHDHPKSRRQRRTLAEKMDFRHGEEMIGVERWQPRPWRRDSTSRSRRDARLFPLTKTLLS